MKMNNSERELSATLNSLRLRGCHVSRDWLTECINFYRSENNQYTPKQLENFVYDQWQLGDLREIAGFGSLPPNLSQILKTSLEGKMACQVEYVTDIGHSSYSQMQKVRQEDVGNLELEDKVKEFQQAWEPKSNRMLQLSLCDGVQTVKAIEYRPIPFLKIDMIPGTKILLKGPVLCRRGVLMLEPRHLEILGGEVDALVITNAYENVLARKLSLPENPDPYKINAAPPPAAINPPPSQQDMRPPQPPNNQQQSVRPQPPQPNNNQSLTRPPLTSNVRNNAYGSTTTSKQSRNLVQPTLSWSKQTQQPSAAKHSSSAQPQAIEFTGSDEDFLNIPLNAADWETEMEYESCNGGREDNRLPTRPQQTNISSQRDDRTSSVNNTKCSPSTFNDDYDMGSDEEAWLLQAEANISLRDTESKVISKPHFITKDNSGCMIERDRTESSACKRSASSALSEETLRKPLFAKKRKETTSSQEVSSTSDLNFLIDDEFLLNSDEIPTGKLEPVNLPSHPFIYLSQIINYVCESPEIFRVKAAVITIVEKLSIIENEWRLAAKISDGSANLDVRLSPEVLKELIGMSPETMQEKKKMMSKEPVKSELRKVLENAQRRLIHLNCLLDIKIVPNQNLPIVVGIEELSPRTVTALKTRKNLS